MKKIPLLLLMILPFSGGSNNNYAEDISTPKEHLPDYAAMFNDNIHKDRILANEIKRLQKSIDSLILNIKP